MQTARLFARFSLAVVLGGGALRMAACMRDGECLVYDHDPASVRVSFRDAVTGEPICDRSHAAKPGKLVPSEGACTYFLAGWYVRDDGGVSTTVELTVKGYAPKTVTFEAEMGECGEPLAPAARRIDLTPDPDAD